MKALLTAVALTVVLGGSAIAQQTSTNDQVPAVDGKPATITTTNQTPPQTSTSTTVTSTAPVTSDSTSTAAVHYLPSQQGNDMLASRVIGAYVMNDAGETVGSVNDVLIDKQGHVTGIVVGVGGFLGIGQTDVAIAYDPSQIGVDENGKRIIKLNVTKEALKNAPHFVKNSNAA